MTYFFSLAVMLLITVNVSAQTKVEAGKITFYIPETCTQEKEFSVSASNPESLQWKMEFVIYNRWGEKVFSTTDALPFWNGKDLKGYNMPSGVYVYTMNATTSDQQTVKKSGNITLIR